MFSPKTRIDPAVGDNRVVSTRKSEAYRFRWDPSRPKISPVETENDHLPQRLYISVRQVKVDNFDGGLGIHTGKGNSVQRAQAAVEVTSSFPPDRSVVRVGRGALRQRKANSKRLLMMVTGGTSNRRIPNSTTPLLPGLRSSNRLAHGTTLGQQLGHLDKHRRQSHGHAGKPTDCLLLCLHSCRRACQVRSKRDSPSNAY